ncbi:DUF2784 domain-containing protein [Salinispira pacifica]
MVGWIWRYTRRIHLLTIGLTLFSWLFLGIWYGFGYCFCTDWHWQIRSLLGNPPNHYSYIQFLVHQITGWNPPRQLTNTLTVLAFAAIITLSLALNLRDLLNRKKTNGGAW